MTAEDVLWRRSKLGLHMKPEERAALEAVMPSGATQPAGGERRVRRRKGAPPWMRMTIFFRAGDAGHPHGGRRPVRIVRRSRAQNSNAH